MSNFHLTNGFNSFERSSTKENLYKREKSTYFNTVGLNVTARQQSSPQTFQKPRKIKAKYRPNYEKLAEKTRTKNHLSKLIRESGDHFLANKMRDCSNFFYVWTTGQCVKRTEETFHCGSRHCPFCATLKAQRKIDDYLPKAQSFYAQNASVTPVHLVLTQKHRKDEQLNDSIDRLLKNFRKLIRRKFWIQHCSEGGIYAVEFTVGRDGNWHTHLHCLVFRRRYFDVKPFRSEWLDVTGDSVNFKVKLIDTLAGGLEEVIGYISKPKDTEKFTVRHVKQVLDLTGVRMFGTFGDFRTFCASFIHSEPESVVERETLVEGDLCDCCSLPLFRVKLDIKGRIELEKQAYLWRHLQKPKPNFVL